MNHTPLEKTLGIIYDSHGMKGQQKIIFLLVPLLALSLCKKNTTTPDPIPKPDVKILTTWKANYTLQGTPVSGIVSYYESGTYDPDSDTGNAQKLKVNDQEAWFVDLGVEAELGSSPEGETKGFDVVVRVNDGLRKVYRNVHMSGTTAYEDYAEGILKLSGFGLDDFIDEWLQVNTINRWRQGKIAAEFNPDIAATSNGMQLFNMSDFMPSEEMKMGVSARESLDRRVREVGNMLQGRKYVAVVDGDHATHRWADFLRKNVEDIKDIKDKDDYKGIEKLVSKGYEVLNLKAKRLPYEYIYEIIRVLKHVMTLSNGVITEFSEPVIMGTRTAADLVQPPDGASWSFYSSVGPSLANGVFPNDRGPVDAHVILIDSDKRSVESLQHEIYDSFFGRDQDVNPVNLDDWMRFSFKRPETGKDNYSIHKNYEIRDGVPDSTNIIQGGKEYLNVTPNIPDTLNYFESPKNISPNYSSANHANEKKIEIKKDN